MHLHGQIAFRVYELYKHGKIREAPAVFTELFRGQRFGMIRFGSCVEVYIPGGYEPAVSIGSTTLAGQTVIARRARQY